VATQVLTNAKVWLDSYDLSGDLNAVAIEQGVDQQEATTFGNDTKITKPGLKNVKASLAGLINLGAGLSEEFLSSKIALADVPMSVGPTTGSEGEPGFSFLSGIASFTPVQGNVGDLMKFKLDAAATSARLVRGTIVHNPARTATGNGTVFNIGAVAAGQFLYAVLHVPAISGGPSVTVKVQSAPTVGFASPTDRITFTAVTVKGSQWAAPIAGAITDAFWRATWTFSGGASPSITFIVNVAIQ
jgi:hypothetical protein